MRVQLACTGVALTLGLLVPGGSTHPARVLGSTLLALLVTWLLASCASRPVPGRPGLEWRAAGWALAPLLVVHWQSWSLVAAAGVALAMWGAARAGAWLVAAVGGVGVTAWILWERLHSSRADLGSSWLLVELVTGTRVEPLWWLTGSVGAVALAVAVARTSWRRSRHRDVVTLARAGLVVLATVLLVLPSAPPEAALVLLPAAAVAVRRWADLLAWQACELVSWVLTGWFLDGYLAPAGGGTEKAYWVAILLRIVGVAWLLFAALRSGRPSVDDDAVERRGGVTHPHVDVLADSGDSRA